MAQKRAKILTTNKKHVKQLYINLITDFPWKPQIPQPA
jgi:hypothetical protein